MDQHHHANGNQHEKHSVVACDEPNNNSKNNSSSSYDDVVDYEDSIQNQDIKDAQMPSKRSSATTDAESLKYMKNFPNRVHYDEHQPNQMPYNGNANDDYRMTTIDERKINVDDGNSSDMRMNYASSDEIEMNPNVADDHGEKMGSGSDDEGENLALLKLCLR